MAIIARPLIVTFYTGAFAEAAIIATLAVAIQIPDGVRSVFTTTANAVDRPELPFRGGVILVGTNLVLDVLLVPTVGPIGAIVASLVGITLATIYVAFGVLSELSVTWRDLPWRQFGAEIFAAVVMAAVVYLFKQTLGLPITPELGLLVVVGVVTYFAVLLAISAEIRHRMRGIAGDLLPRVA